MLLAQQCNSNLRTILLRARKVHSRQDYARMAQPILLEVQQHEQEIVAYLSGDLEQPTAGLGRNHRKARNPSEVAVAGHECRVDGQGGRSHPQVVLVER